LCIYIYMYISIYYYIIYYTNVETNMDNVETLATPKQFNLGLIAYFIMSFGLGVLVCALIFMYF